jgi:Tfp pilus assembly protein PilE
MDKLSTKNKGLSLMQVIILVIIIGLLAAFLIPFIGSYLRERDTFLHSKENLQLVSSRPEMEEIV